jgi:GNAT superfamily N-acetyltransferase
MNITFRCAKKGDAPLLLRLIRQHAKMQILEKTAVTATVEFLDEWLFQKEKAEVFFPLIDGEEVGYVMYNHTFSSYISQPRLYLEDIYVFEKYRRRGVGKAIFRELVRIANERGFVRIVWQCFTGNPIAISFYNSISAKPKKNMCIFDESVEELSKIL